MKSYKIVINTAVGVQVYFGVKLSDLAIEIERFYRKNIIFNSYELTVYNGNGDVIGQAGNSGINTSAKLFECMEMLDPEVGYIDFDLLDLLY
jgi:hypothetical protein